MITGSCYGVVLNAAAERERLAAAFAEAPYLRAPEAPVVYIKPRTCFRFDGAPVAMPPELPEVEVAATIAVLFAKDCGPGTDPNEAIGAACLALDVGEPEASYYRPAIRQRCRDGFLPLGGFVGWTIGFADTTLTTRIDGAAVHQWSLRDLVRPVDRLVRDLASFMTLRSGDLLLVGLAGDAPRAKPGKQVEVDGEGFPPLTTRFELEL